MQGRSTQIKRLKISIHPAKKWRVNQNSLMGSTQLGTPTNYELGCAHSFDFRFFVLDYFVPFVA
jgi:hypothetical protein